MKKNALILSISIIVIIFSGTLVYADSLLDDIEVVFGPRVGFSYTLIDNDEFTEKLNETDLFNGDEYMPYYSQFGFSLEQRIPLGTTKSHFAFQEIVCVGGIDQSIAIPTVAMLLGFRSQIGFEFGLGPIWSLSGFAVLYALGWTFSYQGVYVPVNVVCIPDFKDNHHHFSVFTGFNFHI